MKLKRFLLVCVVISARKLIYVYIYIMKRYYPPGIILEYELRNKSRETKEIDLLHLTPE